MTTATEFRPHLDHALGVVRASLAEAEAASLTEQVDRAHDLALLHQGLIEGYTTFNYDGLLAIAREFSMTEGIMGNRNFMVDVGFRMPISDPGSGVYGSEAVTTHFEYLIPYPIAVTLRVNPVMTEQGPCYCGTAISHPVTGEPTSRAHGSDLPRPVQRHFQQVVGARTDWEYTVRSWSCNECHYRDGSAGATVDKGWFPIYDDLL